MKLNITYIHTMYSKYQLIAELYSNITIATNRPGMAATAALYTIMGALLVMKSSLLATCNDDDNKKHNHSNHVRIIHLFIIRPSKNIVTFYYLVCSETKGDIACNHSEVNTC